MRKYKITAFIGLDSHSKIIFAKNSYEANQQALDFGHKLSNYGRSGFLRGTKVTYVGNVSKRK